MRGIEVAAETEPDAEVDVVEQHPCPGQPGQDGDGAGEVRLETEEGPGVRQRRTHQSLSIPRVAPHAKLQNPRYSLPSTQPVCRNSSTVIRGPSCSIPSRA